MVLIVFRVCQNTVLEHCFMVNTVLERCFLHSALTAFTVLLIQSEYCFGVLFYGFNCFQGMSEYCFGTLFYG